MERTLCIWYPDWPLRRPDVPPDDPAQAVGDDNAVAAVNASAAAAGIAVGMRRREAEGICPTVHTVALDPGADAARFEPVVPVIEGLIPRVELAGPGLVFAPLRGAARYYRGERPLLARVAEALDAVAPGYRLGVGPGPFGARRAADLAGVDRPVFVVEDDREFLASLDISSVGSADLAATFRWLGITTLGDLANLPREAVVTRFGNMGLRAHRLASGEDRPARPREIPVDLSVEEKFSPPLESLEQAAFYARAMAHRLLAEVKALGAVPHRVEIEARAGDGETRIRVWRNSDPFDEATLAERVRWQLRAWLDRARNRSGPGIRGGLEHLRITPADVSDRGRQLGLGEDVVSKMEEERSLSRAQSIVGPDGLLRAVPQGGRTPLERTAWFRWGDEPPAALRRDPSAPWPGAVPGPSPTLMPPEPRPLDVDWDDGIPVRVRLGSRWVEVHSWAGPWRSMGRWWEGEPPSDRYQLVTSVGAFLCEVREGRARLVGVYD